LVPHWEDLLLHTSSSICDAVLSESLDHRIVSIIDSTLEAVIALNTNASSVIDKALNDDKNRSNDGVLFSTDMREKLRSLIVQHPLIVLNRLPVQFGRMIGKVSITQLYLQANFYNNVSLNE
jgi:tRNA pseudouridine-54 N-methylase